MNEQPTTQALERARPLVLVLRTVDLSLCALLVATVAGSALAAGAVHPPVYATLWSVAGLMLVGLALHWGLRRRARELLGPGRFVLARGGRRLFAEDDPGCMSGWTLDADDAPRAAPLAVPLLAFLAFGVIQVLPLPPSWLGHADPTGGVTALGWTPLSIAPRATWRGLAFVATALVVHLASAHCLAGPARRRRLPAWCATLGVALSVVGFVQAASGSTRLYGVFPPLEGDGTSLFGPFVNRNHFGGMMVLLTPLALMWLIRVAGNHWKTIGRVSLRRLLLGLRKPTGTALLFAAASAAGCLAALIATRSRGALTAFIVGLALALLRLAGERRRDAWWIALPVCLALLAVGHDLIRQRFEMSGIDDLGRTTVWRDALGRLDGDWLLGTGFNTFGVAYGGTQPWALPTGATPWPETLRPETLRAHRTPVGIDGHVWFREAHNEYLQLLCETGIVGLLLALWGAARAIAAVRGAPWIMAAVVGALVHAFVEFDFQIPAIPLLFLVLVAAGSGDRRSTDGASR